MENYWLLHGITQFTETASAHYKVSITLISLLERAAEHRHSLPQSLLVCRLLWPGSCSQHKGNKKWPGEGRGRRLHSTAAVSGKVCALRQWSPTAALRHTWVSFQQAEGGRSDLYVSTSPSSPFCRLCFQALHAACSHKCYPTDSLREDQVCLGVSEPTSASICIWVRASQSLLALSWRESPWAHERREAPAQGLT